MDLEDEQAQVDVFGGQQFVALHRVGDGQGDVVGLVCVVAEGVVVDDRFDPHVVVRPLQEQEGALQGRVHLCAHGRVHINTVSEADVEIYSIVKTKLAKTIAVIGQMIKKNFLSITVKLFHTSLSKLWFGNTGKQLQIQFLSNFPT